MNSTDRKGSILYVLSDCPGQFVPLAYALAAALNAQGWDAVFAVSSRYYQRFTGVDLDRLGPVYDVAEFLRTRSDAGPDDIPIDWWRTHATFIRTRYYGGRHPNAWNDYRKVALFYRELFDRHPQISAVWSEIPSNSVISFAQAESEKRAIAFLGYSSARIPGHFNVFLDQHVTRMLENPVASDYTARPEDAPDYMRSQTNSLATGTWSGLFNGAFDKLSRAGRAGLGRSIETELTAAHQLRALWKTLARKLRFALMRRFNDPFEHDPRFDPTRINILFPLHFRPEASTSVQARYYESDLETIRNTAFSLPHRGVLWIKEHASAIGVRDTAFYREIASYPNVRLLGINFPLKQRLADFDALVCLTSTAGFEAIQFGVPVLLLGRTFFENYPGVTRIESWNQLFERLSELTPGRLRVADSEPLRRYLQSCFAGSFNYMDRAVLEPRNIALLAQPLLQVAERGTFEPAAPQ